MQDALHITGNSASILEDAEDVLTKITDLLDIYSKEAEPKRTLPLLPIIPLFAPLLTQTSSLNAVLTGVKNTRPLCNRFSKSKLRDTVLLVSLFKGEMLQFISISLWDYENAPKHSDQKTTKLPSCEMLSLDNTGLCPISNVDAPRMSFTAFVTEIHTSILLDAE
eukprot:IDg8834t1